MQIPRQPWIMPTSPNIVAMIDDIINARVPEMMISGPRNCGKSWIIAQCELSLVEMYPGIQILNARKHDTDFGGLLDQWDNYILEYGLDDKRNPFTFHERTKVEPRKHLRFDNGSKIYFAGMDKKNKALGSALDFVWYNEIQLEDNPEHWSAILGAMEGGRAGNWDGRKHIAICDLNPTHKKFWAYLRAHPLDENKVPEMKHYYVLHKDHPHLYVWSHDKWTQKGVDTVNGLNRAYVVGTFDWLRNVRGEFCNAEGAVFPQFSIDKHVKPINRDDIPFSADWYLSCDFGKIASTGIWAQTDDKLIRFKEIYRKELNPNDNVSKIKALLSGYKIPDPQYAVVDHEFNGRSIMQEAGFTVKLADKTVSIKDGIALLQKALTEERIVINSNSLEGPDTRLSIRCLVDEFHACSYKPESKQTGGPGDDLPDPQCSDHAIDETRYMVVDRITRAELPSFLI